ncbi:MAG: protein jag [Defluviitaleaceae bacterium]|nr:protein jag [Defluviitaleaceae bacterium]MCL2264108.1 protein jag [Defluviitaleaceae bacterium]
METTKTDSVERLAKTVDEAKAEALKILGVSENEAIITVLDEGAKGILGLGSRPAKVRAELKPDPIESVKIFLREVTLAMGLNVTVETNQKDKHLYVNLTGENMGILIGKRGQTLDALQYITNLAVGRHGDLQMSVVIDTENYRRRRRDSLEGLARTVSRKVRDKRQNVKLEPMTRFERHVIHTVLQNDKNVKTFSEGNEPYRHVVIAPK